MFSPGQYAGGPPGVSKALWAKRNGISPSCSKALLVSVNRGCGVGGSEVGLLGAGSNVGVGIASVAVGAATVGRACVAEGRAVGDGSGPTQQPVTNERESTPSAATTSLDNFVIICVCSYDTPSLAHCQSPRGVWIRPCALTCTHSLALCGKVAFATKYKRTPMASRPSPARRGGQACRLCRDRQRAQTPRAQPGYRLERPTASHSDSERRPALARERGPAANISQQ